MLYIRFCTLHTVYGIRYTVYCMRYTVYGILYTVYSILYTAFCIRYTVYCIQYIVYCILYTVYFILHTVYGILYTLYSLLYTRGPGRTVQFSPRCITLPLNERKRGSHEYGSFLLADTFFGCRQTAAVRLRWTRARSAGNIWWRTRCGKRW